MEKLEVCPVCNSQELSSYIQAQDHTLTHETFNIDQCSNCGLRFTNPRPDFNEIGRYYSSKDYISHTDDTRGIINNVYHKVKTITLRQKVNLIKRYASSSQISLLDFGCGTGDFVLAAKEAGMKTQGIEPSEEARQRALNKGLNVLPEHALFNLSPGSFDVITLWHVLEHVHNLKDVFTHICLITKIKGYLFVALPNSDSTDAVIYNENWAALDVPRHLYHFTPESFNYFLSHFPLKLVEKKTMPFDPFYISLLSEKYQTGSTNYLTALFNGLTGLIAGYKEVDKSSSIIYILQRV